MRFLIRDALWMMLAIALIMALNINASRNKSCLQVETERANVAQAKVLSISRELKAMQESNSQILESEKLTRRTKDEEIRGLRELLRLSIKDQRAWFELKVKNKDLVAIGPATTTSPNITLRMVEKIEAETGLNANLLKHFMSPITPLRPK
jgi:hypothetical protein